MAPGQAGQPLGVVQLGTFCDERRGHSDLLGLQGGDLRLQLADPFQQRQRLLGLGDPSLMSGCGQRHEHNLGERADSFRT